MRSISVCSVARVSASSAPSGSSRSSTAGSIARARATATRWRMPPESSLGRFALGGAETDELEVAIHARALLLRRCAREDLLDREEHVLERREPRKSE